LAQAVVQSLDASVEIHVARNPDRENPVARYVPSVDRAATMLGLEQIVSLPEAIRRTARWHVEGEKG
jgi:nucleoside-diphosphate-sugar epimerase